MKTTAASRSCAVEKLLVIDKLVVGPARVEKRRVSTPYTVIQGNREDSFELIYSFNEDVFAPDSSDAQNLGAVITAQAALNYGLFCKEINSQGLGGATGRSAGESCGLRFEREAYGDD